MNDELKQLLLSSGEAGAYDKTHDNITEELHITSIRDAETLLQRYMGPSGSRMRQKIVEYLTTAENRVTADPDRYHNFIMDLFRVGDYTSGLQVCEYVLEYAPGNMDILADALKACGDACQFDLGEAYLDRAMRMATVRWNWRMFLYAVDFLKTKLQAYPADNNLFERASSLAKEYMRCFPTDERGYNQYAELLICVNRREEAIDRLLDFVFETKPGGNFYSKLVCPQCCVTLLELLDGTNDYEKIIAICDRGLAYSAQVQPSASIGYFVYRKALAMDAKIHDMGVFSEMDIQQVLAFYQAAYDLNQDRQYARTIEMRYALLRIHVATNHFRPLIKRRLYVEDLGDIMD